MSIKRKKRTGFTVIEVMIAITLSTIVGVIIATFSIFSARSFVTMADYADMNQDSQLALDKMSKDIRQAKSLTSSTNTSLTFRDASGNSLQFTYSPDKKTLSRISGNNTTILLSNCNSLTFWTYQHTLVSNSFDCYSAAVPANARVIQLTFSCSRKILSNSKATTESVQSAEIVMRNH
jgi:Tfp pilus assembly protein PilW